MSFLTKLLPSWVPLALGALLAAGLVGAYFAWQDHERTLGAAKVEAADAKAVAAQATKDAKLSAALAVKLQGQVSQLQTIAAAGGQRIDLEPMQPGSAAEIDAAKAVRCMLGVKDSCE